MQLLRRFSIGRRIQLAFAAQAVLAVAAIGTAAGALWQQRETLRAGTAAGVPAAELDRLARQSLAVLDDLLVPVAGLGIAFVVTSALMAFALRGSIKSPVEALVRSVIALGAGDLQTRIASPGRDDISWINHELNTMRKKLLALMLGNREAAHAVRETARDIARGNDDLGHRVDEQAAALDATRESLAELARTLSTNADFARQATDLVEQANGVAARSSTLMHDVVGRMNDIHASASRIGEIVQVIDGIAFQTSILALNAAVEAARAGEQGRGFAVVAAEVRALAQRSATAAREVKGLISDSVGKVDAGVGLVDEAGRTIGQLLSDVSQVSTLVRDIASGSAAAQGVGQIEDSIGRINAMARQNAALAEQTRQWTGSLLTHSDSMHAAVDSFRLDA